MLMRRPWTLVSGKVKVKRSYRTMCSQSPPPRVGSSFLFLSFIPFHQLSNPTGKPRKQKEKRERERRKKKEPNSFTTQSLPPRNPRSDPSACSSLPFGRHRSARRARTRPRPWRRPAPSPRPRAERRRWVSPGRPRRWSWGCGSPCPRSRGS